MDITNSTPPEDLESDASLEIPGSKLSINENSDTPPEMEEKSSDKSKEDDLENEDKMFMEMLILSDMHKDSPD